MYVLVWWCLCLSIHSCPLLLFTSQFNVVPTFWHLCLSSAAEVHFLCIEQAPMGKEENWNCYLEQSIFSVSILLLLILGTAPFSPSLCPILLFYFCYCFAGDLILRLSPYTLCLWTSTVDCEHCCSSHCWKVAGALLGFKGVPQVHHICELLCFSKYLCSGYIPLLSLKKGGLLVSHILHLFVSTFWR